MRFTRSTSGAGSSPSDSGVAEGHSSVAATGVRAPTGAGGGDGSDGLPAPPHAAAATAEDDADARRRRAHRCILNVSVERTCHDVQTYPRSRRDGLPVDRPPTNAQDIALRLRGKVLNSAGAPIAKARVQTDATLGPQGAPFGSASRNFNATTNDKGEWGILGVTRGLWIFEGSAAGHAPLAVAVPVNMMHAEANRPGLLAAPSPTLKPRRDARRRRGPRSPTRSRRSSPTRRCRRRRSLPASSSAPAGWAWRALSLCAAGGIALVARDLGDGARVLRSSAEGRRDRCVRAARHRLDRDARPEGGRGGRMRTAARAPRPPTNPFSRPSPR